MGEHREVASIEMFLAYNILQKNQFSIIFQNISFIILDSHHLSGNFTEMSDFFTNNRFYHSIQI